MGGGLEGWGGRREGGVDVLEGERGLEGGVEGEGGLESVLESRIEGRLVNGWRPCEGSD